MSSKMGGIYRIKSQTLSILNLAFNKAGAKRSSQMTNTRRLHQPNANSKLRRSELILSAWCWKLAPISSITHQGRDRQLARSGDNGGDGAAGDRGVAGRLGAGPGGHGRTRHVNRHRRDPATGRGDQERRRLSAGSDRESQGRGVFAWAGADGAAAGKGREIGA